jgi:hypothetical protein
MPGISVEVVDQVPIYKNSQEPVNPGIEDHFPRLTLKPEVRYKN